MSNVSEERSTRQQDIKKGLQFIEYGSVFLFLYILMLIQLVRNLFNEGNDVYREGDWRGSLSHYTEAINIADYANSEEIHVSDDILEKLHVNRIACFSNMGLHEKVLEDCEIALRLNENNFRALYRKAKALNELGRYKKAYDAVAKCSLAVPQDESVIKLTQELAQKLGLKIRKAYVRAKMDQVKYTFFQQINGPSSLFGSENYMGIAGQTRNEFSNVFSSATANIPVSSALAGRNPLEGTHELRQACQLCFVKKGPKLLDYAYHPNLEHKCKKDILIGRIKNSEDKSWKKIRPRPTKTQYVGPYYICKDVAAEEECRYPGHCTFAYCQEEIDVWTLERKGAFSREALFGGNGKINFTVSRLLQEHHGLFMFLCEKCFDHKPRIISKRNKDNASSCSHPAMHDFEDNKCLVHILRETMVKYSKIRPFQVRCQLDLCRHEVHYGCLREDKCFYAHSLVELKVWIMQKETGISHDAIVQESKKYWQNMEASTHGSQILGNQMKYGSLNLKMKFVCGQCWRNGQVNEPDRNKKYCSAKARHPWTKDRRVVLVMSNERKKWMTIRPLPAKKQVPLQFDLCNHIASGKKCQYDGNCSFAHSPEEREMWTYMKENSIQDLEQLYDIWLKSQKPEKGDDTAAQANKENGKQIHMPTDYVDFHCWMCGKNCNSEKQWQGHISSEKHKEKVFHTEDDQNCWQYRFPTGYFSICDRYMAGTCTEGNNCKFAHGNAELHEWEERRQVLRMKLSKARKDHLIAPSDNDFGKYSFLWRRRKGAASPPLPAACAPARGGATWRRRVRRQPGRRRGAPGAR
uniref:Zinc finger CCCH-type containing 7A n=1 Tax=Anser brachyrhynchus TaxID=132585 RepID=A0A8B9BX47_9AVES